MEYVEYYLTNLLRSIDIPQGSEVLPAGGTIILNNIAGICYDEAVAIAKTIVINKEKQTEKDGKKVLLKELLLTEKEFVNSVSLVSLDLDAKKLWKLCVLLYAMVGKELVAVTKLTAQDEYMRLYIDFKRDLDITSITVNGVMNERGKTYNITSEALVADMCKMLCNLKYGLAITNINSEGGYDINDEGICNYSYEIESLTTIDAVVDKRVISYRFALELEAFIKSYLKIELNTEHKMLILQILYLFGQFKNNPPSNTDNYRKLMSDGRKLLVDKPIMLLNDKPLPFTIMVNPESMRIRSEFRQLIKEGKCEI